MFCEPEKIAERMFQIWKWLFGFGKTSDIFAEEQIAYLPQWAPIGCRDYYTLQNMQKQHIPAYLFGCITATFPARKYTPEQGKVFLVDVPEQVKTIFLISLKKIAWKLPRNGKQIFHQNYSPRYTKIYRETEKLFQRYKKEAALVVTSHLHCASPCRALGIPTILEMEENLRGLHGLKESAYLHTG